MLPPFVWNLMFKRSVLLLTLITFCYGRTFEKCNIAEKLSTNGFTDTEIRVTLCYAQLSDYDNWFVVTLPNGTFYGLFGIYEPWCASDSENISKSICNDLCRNMMDDHLRNDINCLRKMYDGDGRWSREFKQFYLENTLSDLKECEKNIVDDCIAARKHIPFSMKNGVTNKDASETAC